MGPDCLSIPANAAATRWHPTEWLAHPRNCSRSVAAARFAEELERAALGEGLWDPAPAEASEPWPEMWSARLWGEVVGGWMVVGSELSEEARPCEVSRSLRVKPTLESFVAAMRGLALSLFGSNLTPLPHEGYIV